MSELDDERAAHEEIAEICFACGVETDDGTSVSAVRNLAARLSRYETAMREALRILGPAWRYKDAAAILRAALSDQPAEEPAESKLEVPNELLKLVAQAFFIIGSLELSSFGNREANGAASAWRKKASAVLDAQPSTSEPKGE